MNKHLTIRDATNEKNKLENQLMLYLSLKKINYVKTQPGAIKYKDIITNKSNFIFDRFTQYIIKDDEYDDKIYSLMESINSYEKYIIEEMKRLSQIEPNKLKVYLLREDLDFYIKFNRKRTWLEIGELLNYSDRQARRIYNEVVKGRI